MSRGRKRQEMLCIVEREEPRRDTLILICAEESVTKRSTNAGLFALVKVGSGAFDVLKLCWRDLIPICELFV
jgi:hypothetical protein